MHRPPPRSNSTLDEIKAKFRALDMDAEALVEKLESDAFEPARDMAICADLWQRKADLYGELMECDEWIKAE